MVLYSLQLYLLTYLLTYLLNYLLTTYLLYLLTYNACLTELGRVHALLAKLVRQRHENGGTKMGWLCSPLRRCYGSSRGSGSEEENWRASAEASGDHAPGRRRPTNAPRKDVLAGLYRGADEYLRASKALSRDFELRAADAEQMVSDWTDLNDAAAAAWSPRCIDGALTSPSKGSIADPNPHASPTPTPTQTRCPDLAAEIGLSHASSPRAGDAHRGAGVGGSGFWRQPG